MQGIVHFISHQTPPTRPPDLHDLQTYTTSRPTRSPDLHDLLTSRLKTSTTFRPLGLQASIPARLPDLQTSPPYLHNLQASRPPDLCGSMPACPPRPPDLQTSAAHCLHDLHTSTPPHHHAYTPSRPPALSRSPDHVAGG